MGEETKRAVANIKAKFTRGVTSLVKEVSLDVLNNLREDPPEGTPVDTGWSRANWIATTGTPVASAVGTRKNVQDVLEGYSIINILSFRAADRRIYIVNNVPYIRKLDEGYSKQTPAGFVLRAVEKAVAKANLKVPGLLELIK